MADLKQKSRPDEELDALTKQLQKFLPDSVMAREEAVRQLDARRNGAMYPPMSEPEIVRKSPDLPRRTLPEISSKLPTADLEDVAWKAERPDSAPRPGTAPLPDALPDALPGKVEVSPAKSDVPTDSLLQKMGKTVARNPGKFGILGAALAASFAARRDKGEPEPETKEEVPSHTLGVDQSIADTQKQLEEVDKEEKTARSKPSWTPSRYKFTMPEYKEPTEEIAAARADTTARTEDLKKDRDTAETRTYWTQVASTLAKGLAKYAAAREADRKGVFVDPGKMDFGPETDYDRLRQQIHSDYTRSTERLSDLQDRKEQALTKGARDKYDDLIQQEKLKLDDFQSQQSLMGRMTEAQDRLEAATAAQKKREDLKQRLGVQQNLKLSLSELDKAERDMIKTKEAPLLVWKADLESKEPKKNVSTYIKDNKVPATWGQRDKADALDDINMKLAAIAERKKQFAQARQDLINQVNSGEGQDAASPTQPRLIKITDGKRVVEMYPENAKKYLRNNWRQVTE